MPRPTEAQQLRLIALANECNKLATACFNILWTGYNTEDPQQPLESPLQDLLFAYGMLSAGNIEQELINPAPK